MSGFRLAAKTALTKRVEVQRQMNTLSDRLIRIFAEIDPRRLDSQGFQPHSQTRTIVAPKRVFQGAHTMQVRPVRFDPIRKYLHIVPDFLVARLDMLMTSQKLQRRLTRRGRRRTSLPSRRNMIVATMRSSAGSPRSIYYEH